MGIAVCQEGISPGKRTDGLLGFPGIGAAPIDAVGIAAQEMDQPPIIEPVDAAEGTFSEISGEAALIALEQDAFFHPLADHLRLRHDGLIPFRMGQDGQIAPELELIKQVPGFQGCGGGQQLHQEIDGAGQAAVPVFSGAGQIVQGVRIQAHLRPAVKADGDLGSVGLLLELDQPFRDEVPVGTDAPAVEMGRSKKVGGAGRRSLAQHGQGHGLTAGSVVSVDVI